MIYPDNRTNPDKHIAAERLAALVDSPRTLQEERHLASCGRCNAALMRLEQLRQSLATIEPLRSPAHIRARVVAAAMHRQQEPHRRPWLGWAAAAALFVSGVLVGAVAARNAPSGNISSGDWLVTRMGDPVARVALLEAVALSARAALAQAPQDPGIRVIHERLAAERRAAAAALSNETGGVRWF